MKKKAKRDYAWINHFLRRRQRIPIIADHTLYEDWTYHEQDLGYHTFHYEGRTKRAQVKKVLAYPGARIYTLSEMDFLDL